MANFNVDVNATIADGSIANAKLADMNEATIKGREDGAGVGVPQDLTADQVSDILDGATDPFQRTGEKSQANGYASLDSSAFVPAAELRNFDGLVAAQTPTVPAGERVLRWNDTEGTLEIGLKGGTVVLQIGQEEVAYAKSASSSGIANGSAYYAAGSDGTNLTVELAQANSANVLKFAGVATESVAGASKGFITVHGLVRGLNTAAFTEGDILYVSSSAAGGIVNVKPAYPNYVVRVGYCIRSHASQGIIYVDPHVEQRIDEIGGLGSGVATALNNDPNTASGFVTQTGGDSRYLLASNEIIGVLGTTQNTASATLVDCTGLSVAVDANSNYQVEGFILFQSASATNGIWMSVNGPTIGSGVVAINFNIPSSATANQGRNIIAYNGGSATTDVPALNTTYHALMNGIFITGATAGSLQFRFASEGAGTQVSIMAGSSIRLRKVA